MKPAGVVIIIIAFVAFIGAIIYLIGKELQK